MANATDTPKIPEMVERVARKLFSDGAGLFLLDTPNEPRWEDASPLRQIFLRTVAANLIRELREPTAAMIDQGVYHHGRYAAVPDAAGGGWGIEDYLRSSLADDRFTDPDEATDQAENRNATAVWQGMIDAALGK